MIHIIVGNEAANNLSAAFALDPNLEGEILILKDTLNIGRVFVDENTTHDEVRTNTWKEMAPSFSEEVTDAHVLLQTIERAVENEEPMCVWLAACASDMCAYYWLLKHCKAHNGLLHTINIVGLPFFNEKGQLFYPKNFSEIPAKEFIKCKRLLKEISLSEYETEGDDWEKLCIENMMVRTYEGGKKIVSRDVAYFDNIIQSTILDEKQKLSKVLSEVLKKCTQSVSDLFFVYRIKTLAEEQKLELIGGNINVSIKDVEVKKITNNTLQP